MQNWENLKARFQNFNHTFHAHVVQHQEANTKKKKWAFWLDNDMLSMWSMLQVIEFNTAQKDFE